MLEKAGAKPSNDNYNDKYKYDEYDVYDDFNYWSNPQIN